MWPALRYSRAIACVVGDRVLQLVDVSDPNAPLYIGDCDSSSLFFVRLKGVVAYTSRLGIFPNASGLSRDISNPNAPSQIDTFPSVRYFDIVDNTMFSVNANGLRAIDIADRPTLS